MELGSAATDRERCVSRAEVPPYFWRLTARPERAGGRGTQVTVYKKALLYAAGAALLLPALLGVTGILAIRASLERDTYVELERDAEERRAIALNFSERSERMRKHLMEEPDNADTQKAQIDRGVQGGQEWSKGP